MQSSHHKISFLEFSKFSEKLQIYINNTLAYRFSSRFSSRFNKLDNNCIIHDTNKNTMLFDTSTANMQSSYHKISFLEFSKFSEKLHIYVNPLALQTIISSFNNPPRQKIMYKLFSILFDISTAKMQCSHYQINFLEFFKLSEKLQIYVNTLALQTIISISNNPPWTRSNAKIISILI